MHTSLSRRDGCLLDYVSLSIQVATLLEVRWNCDISNLKNSFCYYVQFVCNSFIKIFPNNVFLIKKKSLKEMSDVFYSANRTIIFSETFQF